jgi:transcriptional regulator with XRE-family HTH domain
MSQITNLNSKKATLNDRVAANLRAEMAAQRKTVTDLAEALHVGHRAATRRWSGDQDIGLNDLDQISVWLEIPVSTLMTARERQVA